MKSKLLSAFLVSSSFASGDAQEPINETLRNALYAEEVTRDNEAAAKQYEEVISRYQSQREFAATALFRLAEVRRKQDRKGDAIKLYQKLVTEFPASEKQIALAKEQLTALGAEIPAPSTTPSSPLVLDDDSKELARIRSLEKTSPDIANSGSLITAAAKANQLRVVTYLLERGMNPDVMGEGETGPTTPLGMAISNGNLAMCEVLIRAGAKVEGIGKHTPMFLAIDNCRVKIIELLIQQGLDVNKKLPTGKPPLLAAISRGYQPTVDLLLDSGADVNAVVPEDQVSALHMAVFFEDTKLVERLLKMGADPTLVSKAKWKSYSMPYSDAPFEVRPGDTPLMVAVGRGNTKLMELMLAKAKVTDLTELLARAVDTQAATAATWLMEKGADPKATNANGMPLIILATRRWDPAMIRTLLAHGADPNVMFTGRMVPPNTPASHAGSYQVGTYSALRIAAGADISESSTKWPRMEVFRTLLEGGAKPDDEWLKGLTGEATSYGTPTGTTNEMRQTIARRFAIPALTDRPAVTLIASPFYKDLIVLETKGPSEPQEFARLLLLPQQAFKLAVKQFPNEQQPPTSFTVWRRNSDGKVTQAAEGLLTQARPFPSLRWGDVVELHDTEIPDDSTNLTFRDNFPESLSWQLQRRISFPVSIEINGKSETYQIRGDRFAFDPTKKELPWDNIKKIGQIFENPPASWEKAVVSRKGWPDFELDISEIRIAITVGPTSQEPPKPFYLQSGDAVRFIASSASEERRKDETETMKSRRASVRIESSELPVQRIYHLNPGGSAIPAPTLVEAVADILSSKFPVPAGTPPWEIMMKSQSRLRMGVPEVIWNHPDLGNLRIRRLGEDGKEEILKVDLNSIIASSKASETPEEARKKDVRLQAGDILEIPLKGDTNESWTGLDAKQAAFFAKVLDCRVQLQSQKEEVSLKEIRYRPLLFQETEGGKYPFLSGDSKGTVSSTRVFDMLWTENSAARKLIRDGKMYYQSQSFGIFAHDGDQISWEPIDYNKIFSTPKPRVVPPAPQNR